MSNVGSMSDEDRPTLGDAGKLHSPPKKLRGVAQEFAADRKIDK